MHITSYWGAFA